MSPTITEAPLAGEREDLDRIAAALAAAARSIVPEVQPQVVFEAPRRPEFGDFATNVAFSLAKAARRPPPALAQQIVERAFDDDPGLRELVAQMQPVAGFINIRLAPRCWQAVVARVLRDGDDYGRGAPTGTRVSLEFGSANPVGPLVVVQCRSLSIGATIANAMRFRGDDVTVEWIINDAGNQLVDFARSIYARYRQLVDPAYPFPEGGYPAEYVVDLARALRERDGARWDDAPESEWLPAIARFGRDTMVAEQRATCERFHVHYDLWQSEKALHETGAVQRGIDALAERGLIYEEDGAIWVRATRFGDDKDRVLVRSDRRPTYYAGDVAYHYDKLARGADRIVDILGPDHHGYIKRLELIATAFGRPGAIEVLIAQQMTLLRGGEQVAMSKRAGNVLTLDEVIDEVGADAARFFFIIPSPDSPLTFDLALAKEQSNENPVYYVQYGHARIASILKRAPEAAVARAREGRDLERLVEPSELALARRLAEFPGIVRSVADTLAPQRLARYARDVATDFHQFYTDCRVLTDDASLTAARLALALAAKTVLAQVLGLIGVSAPESM